MEGNILLLDIETLPALGWFWDKPWQTSIIEVEKEWQILSFSAKWLGGEHETHINHLTDCPLVKRLWKFLDKADIVVAHNGDRFDIRKINARFLYYEMPPPSPYKTIDTLKISRKNFGLLSHRQNDLSKFMGTGEKLRTDKHLWLDCIKGDKKALKQMAEYNAHDVVLLEKNYLKLRGWYNGPASLSVYHEDTRCSHCGSKNLIRKGYSYNKTTKYPRIRCKDCGGYGRIAINMKENKPIVSI